MDDSIEDIMADYLVELRLVWPTIWTWWEALLAEDEEAVPLRWPTGPAGHPKFIDIFRRHYIRIDALNRSLAVSYKESEPREPTEGDWGVDDEGSAPPEHRPVDFLIFAAVSKAPEMKALFMGLVFLPIAIDPDGRIV